ncbi:hypothetical protein [Kribbella sp. VKM Ac-2566]|uniref:hypothetical protein n=1 Tax=Kribbella sp. VKM Ac-2566 TaxID=2512218 RepID=UPI001416F703|nr:hypothetical protein [Kribbella sp. VKM Ac-2566]
MTCNGQSAPGGTGPFEPPKGKAKKVTGDATDNRDLGDEIRVDVKQAVVILGGEVSS